MRIAAFALLLLVATSADARPISFASKTKYADIEFSYSTEAAAVPALVRKFRADLAKERSSALSCGKQESTIRIQTGGQAIACSSMTKYTTSGQTARLLSLAKSYYAFTGGAHGNGGTTPLLWDRSLGKEIKFASLFRTPIAYGPPVRAAYCRALGAERRKRRGPDYQPNSMVPEFDACPKFSDLSLIPSGSPHFRQLHIIAAPYTAGPYSEGEYDIVLPVTPDLLAALKPEYRASFAAQRQ
jgi:hypothetical protein